MEYHDTLEFLFTTDALRLSPADKPFWYTSGLFGPYYINTHFLFGGEEAANKMLTQIEEAVQSPLTMTHQMARLCISQFEKDSIYRSLMEHLAEEVKTLEFDVISGGERRDFFFSLILAHLLQKPHLSILKNADAYYSDAGFHSCHQLRKSELKGKKVLHVADLLTEGSSYIRSWLPAISESGAEITDTFVVINRKQGGDANLAPHGVKVHALFNIDMDFFDAAISRGKMNEAQKEQVLLFSADPTNYVVQFLKSHPGYLEAEAARDSKTRERVERCKSLGFGQEG